MYREILDLFVEKRDLIEPSTAKLQLALVAFLDVWRRDSEAKISFETTLELQKRRIGEDPQTLLLADLKHHADRLFGLLNSGE